MLETVDNGTAKPETLARIVPNVMQLKSTIPQLQSNWNQQQADQLKAQVADQLLAPVLHSLGIRADLVTHIVPRC